MDSTWKRGLDLLAKTVREDATKELNMLVVAELMDKLLVATGECQDSTEIEGYLVEQHDWDRCVAAQAAMLYAVVEMIRTSSTPQNVYWNADLMGTLGGVG